MRGRTCYRPAPPAATAAGTGEEGEDAAGAAAVDADDVCPLTALSRVLTDPSGFGDRQRRVMAFVDFGPELLYRTPHAVFSIPNHRFQAGFTATYEAMTAPTDREAEAILRDNGVDLLVLCPEWPLEADFYGSDGGPGMFYGRLLAGTVPPYLQPVTLPDDLVGWLDGRSSLARLDPFGDTNDAEQPFAYRSDARRSASSHSWLGSNPYSPLR